MIKLQFKLPQTLISRGFTQRTVLPISTTIFLNQNKSNGPNYWKLNTSILNDKQYKELIQKNLASWQKQKIQYQNFTDWWDMYSRPLCLNLRLRVQRIVNFLLIMVLYRIEMKKIIGVRFITSPGSRDITSSFSIVTKTFFYTIRKVFQNRVKMI